MHGGEKRNSIFHLRNLRGRKGSSRNKKHARKLFFPEKDKNNDASTLHTFFRQMALAFDCAWWLVDFLTACRGADWTVWSLYVGAMSLFSLNAKRPTENSDSQQGKTFFIKGRKFRNFQRKKTTWKCRLRSLANKTSINWPITERQ